MTTKGEVLVASIQRSTDVNTAISYCNILQKELMNAIGVVSASWSGEAATQTIEALDSISTEVARATAHLMRASDTMLSDGKRIFYSWPEEEVKNG